MNFFKRKELSNELTQLIQQNRDVELETVLLHPQLSATIRNESSILYKRVLRNDKDFWFYNIISYALFNKNPPKKFQHLNKINQINHNAANFLESCGKNFVSYFKKDSDDQSIQKSDQLQNYLSTVIINFINSDVKIRTNPMCAGHFQRFVENFLRHQAFEHSTTINLLTQFLVNNCRILAYQQLISRILSDFSGTCDDSIIYCLITQVLQRSCIAVKYIKSKKDPNGLETALSCSIKLNKIQKVNDKTQPLNLLKKPIPLTGVVFTKNEEFHDLNESSDPPEIPWKSNIPKTNEKIRYNSVEDAEIEAYLLIMSLRTSVFDLSDLVDQFREKDSQRGFPLIQALFYCGTRSGVKSLVSLEAFRLLSVIFNGSVALSIDGWKSSEEEKSELDFYNKYADEMLFDPDCLTYKMIHALPVFWNHRYNKDYKQTREEKEEVDVSDYYNDNKQHIRKRKPGETALEILQPCLFCEPAISSQLIFAAIDIFNQLAVKRKDLLKEEKKSKETIDSMVEIDGIMLDFYQHKFAFGPEFPKTTLAKLVSKQVIIPLPSVDKYYYETEDNKRRTSLSGFVIDFFLKISMPSNPFFVIRNGEKNPYCKMIRRPCFTCNNIAVFYEYRQLSNFELLDPKTIYNIPIHNDFYFDDDEIEQDDNPDGEKLPPVKFNMVVVDELSSSSKSHKPKRPAKPPKSAEVIDNDDDDEMPKPPATKLQ